MDLKSAEERREWVLSVNSIGKRYGFDDIAGDRDSPGPEWVDMFNDGLNPQQAIFESFGYLQDG